MSIMKCPHCGREYSQRACRPLVPVHKIKQYNSHTCDKRLEQCPGSGQVPRNAETDMRPLWKDELADPTMQPDYVNPIKGTCK